MENYCENCGALLKNNAHFCQNCGTKVENVQNICSNCGEKLDETTIFCPECGTNIADELPVSNNTCPNCGENIEDSENFCENCGHDLKNQNVAKKNNFIKQYKIPLIVGATILIVAVIILAAISFVPTEKNVGTKVVSVGSHEFEIPGDYVISPSSIDVDYTGYSAVFSQGYSNKDGEIIYLTVMTVPYNVDGESVAASNGGVQKNMMGVNGYYKENDVDVYSFAFVDGKFLNVVGVSSPYIFDEITYLG